MFEKRIVNWDSTPELGDIFLENTAFIKLYKYYVNNFDKSIITLKTVREKNPTFQQFAQVPLPPSIALIPTFSPSLCHHIS
jgi:hypothetical protein